MSNAAPLGPEATRLLEQSTEWRLFGLLFEYPTAAWRADLESLMSCLPADLRDLAAAALAHSTEGLHIALFGPAGSVPVREVTYRGGVQFGYLMAELSAYYEAFGYQPAVAEAADHLAVQLNFVAFLKLKQACALFDGDSANASLTEAAIQEFLREHLATQAEPVARRMPDFGPEYMVDAAVRIAAYAGPAPRSGYPLAAIDDDAEEMSCGPAATADALVQLEP